MCRKVVHLMSVIDTGIVVGVDGSEHADSALLWAWLESQGQGTPLTAANAGGAATSGSDEATHTFGAPGYPSTITDAVARLNDALQHQYADFLPAGVDLSAGPAALGIRGVTVSGPIVPGLLECARDAQMLVVGRRGLGRLGRIFMGSVSAGLAREAQIPVTIVPTRWPYTEADPLVDASGATDQNTPAQVHAGAGPRRVVVGVDGSTSSRTALEYGIHVARRTGAVLEAVACWQIMSVAPLPHGHGWAPPLEDYETHVTEMLDATLTLAFEAVGPLPDGSVHRVVKHAAAARGLLEHAVGAERVVVGHRGLGGFDRLLLGSVSSQLIEHAPCPVTVIRTF